MNPLRHPLNNNQKENIFKYTSGDLLMSEKKCLDFKKKLL